MSTLGKIGIVLMLVAFAGGILIAVLVPGAVTFSESKPETLGPFTVLSFGLHMTIIIRWWVALSLLLTFVGGLACVLVAERRSRRGQQDFTM